MICWRSVCGPGAFLIFRYWKRWQTFSSQILSAGGGSVGSPLFLWVILHRLRDHVWKKTQHAVYVTDWTLGPPVYAAHGGLTRSSFLYVFCFLIQVSVIIMFYLFILCSFNWFILFLLSSPVMPKKFNYILMKVRFLSALLICDFLHCVDNNNNCHSHVSWGTVE